MERSLHFYHCMVKMAGGKHSHMDKVVVASNQGRRKPPGVTLGVLNLVVKQHRTGINPTQEIIHKYETKKTSKFSLSNKMYSEMQDLTVIITRNEKHNCLIGKLFGERLVILKSGMAERQKKKRQDISM